VLTMPTHGYTLQTALSAIAQDLRQGQGGYVCLANVHMCMEAYDDPAFAEVLQHARYVLADGRPIFWAQKLLGAADVAQIRGFDLVLAICEMAAAQGLRLGLYGGLDQAVLQQLEQQLCQRFPALNIVYSYAPPYFSGPLPLDTPALALIKQQQVQILLVGLGCPKQERWMAMHQAHMALPSSSLCAAEHLALSAKQSQAEPALPLMFGVGAAFDYLAGSKRHAPTWLQTFGLEWLYRLLLEPQRLTGRYLKHNPRFILHFGWQWIRSKIKGVSVVS
jgi:N-acetylglucosaminyldiphosphoundecaprenol N-acetyl-beta-D-mannosaminyltransferase